MAAVGPSTLRNSEQDDKALLQSFLGVLNADAPITLPRETLNGAITHYLSTLTHADLATFVQALVTSTSLYSLQGNAGGIREAARISVGARITVIIAQLDDTYLQTRRKQSRARNWLKEISHALKGIENKQRRSVLLVGLLQGVNDHPEIDWGKTRDQLEEEVVMTLAPMLDTNVEHLGLLCSVMPCIQVDRLRALPMKDYLLRISTRLFARLQDYTPSENSRALDEIPTYARALGRAFIVLDSGGPSSREYAWQYMAGFCLEMEQQQSHKSHEVSQSRDIIAGQSPDQHQWEEQKTALFAFLLPAQAILTILLHDDPPLAGSPSGIHPSAELAIHLLITLSTFSSIVSRSKGGLEGYQDLLYGSLDVLSARGGCVGVKKFFQALEAGRKVKDVNVDIGADTAAFMLVLGEQVISLLDEYSLTEILLPLANRHVHTPTHRASFEAAHAFLLAIVESAAKSNVQLQKPFLQELLISYAPVLLRQLNSKDLTSDQFHSAYLTLIESSPSPESTRTLASLLLAQSQSADTQTIRLTRISIAPYIPHHEVKPYLEDLSTMIMGTEVGTERLELAASAFRMVVQELSDEGRLDGMSWWGDWRGKFEGDNRGRKARL